jgi:hypothetical protein
LSRSSLWGLFLLSIAWAQPPAAWQLVVSRHTEARGPSRYLEIRLNSQGSYQFQSTTTASVMRRKPIVQKRQGKLTAERLRAVKTSLQHPDLWRTWASPSPPEGPTRTTLRILGEGTFREFSSAAGTLSPAAERVIDSVEQAVPRL